MKREGSAEIEIMEGERIGDIARAIEYLRSFE
jgi:hypothetical protein